MTFPLSPSPIIPDPNYLNNVLSPEISEGGSIQNPENFSVPSENQAPTVFTATDGTSLSVSGSNEKIGRHGFLWLQSGGTYQNTQAFVTANGGGKSQVKVDGLHGEITITDSKGKDRVINHDLVVDLPDGDYQGVVKWNGRSTFHVDGADVTLTSDHGLVTSIDIQSGDKSKDVHMDTHFLDTGHVSEGDFNYKKDDITVNNAGILMSNIESQAAIDKQNQHDQQLIDDVARHMGS